MNNRIVEATRYFEGLVALARQLEPTSIKTARDLVHLSQLYSKVDWTDKQHATLSQGVDIYYNLTPDDEKLLLPMERASATVELETLSGMLADRADSPGEASGKGDVLRKLLQPLEREVSRIEMFPEIVPQQIYNDHLASYESDCLREARNRFLDHRFSLKWWGIIRRFLRGLPRSLMNTSFEE
jgi:hypothetical protein